MSTRPPASPSNAFRSPFRLVWFQAFTESNGGKKPTEWCVCLHLYKEQGSTGGDLTQCSKAALADVGLSLERRDRRPRSRHEAKLLEPATPATPRPFFWPWAAVDADSAAKLWSSPVAMLSWWLFWPYALWWWPWSWCAAAPCALAILRASSAERH